MRVFSAFCIVRVANSGQWSVVSGQSRNALRCISFDYEVIVYRSAKQTETNGFVSQDFLFLAK